MGEERSDTNARPAPPRTLRPKASWIPVVALCIWLAIEIGRPSHPLRLPLLCSLLLVGLWIAAPSKRWHPVIVCSIGFLITGWIGVPMAANGYSSFWACYSLSIAILCISIPGAHFLKTIRQIHVYVLVFMIASAYVGVFAITHAGFGPAGAGGGQDENYVSAAMSAALPFAYFGLSATKNLAIRISFMSLIAINLLATVTGFSRGGFLGIAAAGLFCFWYSPQKLVAIVAAIVGLGLVVSVAPDKYWDEVRSIGDTKESTADMRIELWTIATREFLANPVFGVAPGNFIWNISKYQSDDQQEKFGRSLGGSALVHSTFFEILSELGAVGSGFFLAMLYFAFRELRRIAATCDGALQSRRRQKTRDSDLLWARSFALAFQGGLIGYLVCSVFLSTTYYSTIWLMCAGSVALSYAVTDILATGPRVGSDPRQVETNSRPDQVPKMDSPRREILGRPEPSSQPPPPRLSDLLGERDR